MKSAKASKEVRKLREEVVAELNKLKEKGEISEEVEFWCIERQHWHENSRNTKWKVYLHYRECIIGAHKNQLDLAFKDAIRQIKELGEEK